MSGAVRFTCDAFGCDESFPLEHEDLGQPCFGTGRFLGWIFIDLNRPDLFPRDLRFCGVRCAEHWLHWRAREGTQRPLTPLDKALRNPVDEMARQRALTWVAGVRQ